MIVPDVNVLLALAMAHHSHHDVATTWAEQAIEDGEAWAIPDVILSGVVRIGSNPRLSQPPLRPPEILTWLDDLRAMLPVVGWIDHPDTESRFRTILSESGVVGKGVADAYIAALASSYGATVVTFDRDFRRFAGVKLELLPLT
jgi:toxin-antitoxin system PIN domain toxin